MATRGRSGTVVGLAVGTRCYVPDKQRIWVPVTVEYVDPQRQIVTFSIDSDDKDSKATIEMSLAEHPQFPLQNARALTHGGYEDMIELNHLHEAAILYNLKRRFHARLPYTFTGDICLAVNPYQWIEELYTEDLHAKYLSASNRKLLPPHAYAVSVAAYKHMKTEGENQSILVSGESGAGKTETTKILMDNLARIANAADSKQQQSTIQRILDVNPLLESFGNAKTKRNDNSSRFGKFTQLQFQQHSRRKTIVLCGAKCETYLLEKTRVVTQEKGERNYHIFYQIFHGSSAEEKQEWGMDGSGDCTQFTYIEDDDVHLRQKDTKNFAKTKHALSLLGLDVTQQAGLFQTLAGVLHIGQASFVTDKQNDEASQAVHSSMMVAAELLGLELAPMEKALCTRTMKAGGEVYAVPLTCAQASSSRDALAKAIYSNLFAWMVDRINISLSAQDADVNNTIGVLDIFGFESFVHNSFEQLCINYANEKLQQKFTEDVFKAVQEEYQAEQITWDHISYADNADVLALIEGKLGIIALLNEEIVRPKGNDEGFVGKLTTAFRTSKKVIEFPRISRTQFSIHHYADTVKYEAIGFLEKHKDALLPDLSDLMRGSSLRFVKDLFEVKQVEAPEQQQQPQPGRARRAGGGNGGSSDSQTVGTQFKLSLNRLMENINKTNVHYIRCIKPNSEKSTTKIDEQMVVNQLRCAGVIEAICIARAGYPNRMKHQEFVREFDLFLSDAQRQRVGDEQKLCVVLAKMFHLTTPEEYQMGKSKIYLQKGVLEKLETAKAEKLFACVALIQSQWRGWLARQLFARMYAAIRVIQRRAHVFVATLRFKRAQWAVRFMQRVWRGYVGRCEYHAVLCQDRAARIQRVWRGYKGRCVYHERLCQVRAIQIQCAWRSFKSRKTLFVLQVAYAKEQERLRLLELERQRQLELQRKREQEELDRQRRLAAEAEALRLKQEREEMERQRRIAEEAMAEAARRKQEREDRERREREEQERLERERIEAERQEQLRLEQLERERVEAERQERLRQEQLERERIEAERQEKLRLERLERERREREEEELRQREEDAAINVQRVTRGRLARQKYAKLTLEEEVLRRKAAIPQDDPVELEEAKNENARLKKQLEELLQDNIELETMVSELKCETDVLTASQHLRETDLNRQITQQKQKLQTAKGEYSTLTAYLDQNGAAKPRRMEDRRGRPERDGDSDSNTSSDGEGEGFASPFAIDRPSVDVASVFQRPSSNRSRREDSRIYRASANQLDRAKTWVNRNAAARSSSSQARPAADQTTSNESSRSSTARLRFRWGKK